MYKWYDCTIIINLKVSSDNLPIYKKFNNKKISKQKLANSPAKWTNDMEIYIFKTIYRHIVLLFVICLIGQAMVCFDSGSHLVVKPRLELTIQPRMSSNLQQFTCLIRPVAGITGGNLTYYINHHTVLPCSMSKHFLSPLGLWLYLSPVFFCLDLSGWQREWY